MDKFNRFIFNKPKQDDIIEVIVDGLIYTCQRQKQAETLLSEVVGNDINIFLDYHGVADLFATDYKFIDEKQTDKKSVIISFVGRSGKSRETTRKALMERIKHKQIVAGILVFNRLKGADKIPRCVGTKAWVISILAKGVNKAIFLDDSHDHIELVECSKLPQVSAHLVKSKQTHDITKLISSLGD
jgi:hypothetical protein